MNINYSAMNYDDDYLFQTIEKWHNSFAIKKNYLLNFSDEDTKRKSHWRDIQERFRNDQLERFVIFDGDTPIGEFNYHLSHPLQKLKDSFWIGIAIGEETYKGSGVANFIMSELEGIAKTLNRFTMEIGVYAFNERGLRFYKKLGYEEFDRDEDFAYWGGDKWPFVRMKKVLH